MLWKGIGIENIVRIASNNRKATLEGKSRKTHTHTNTKLCMQRQMSLLRKWRCGCYCALLLLSLIFPEPQPHSLGSFDETRRALIHAAFLPFVERFRPKWVDACIVAFVHNLVICSDALFHLYLSQFDHQGLLLVGRQVLYVLHGAIRSRR